MHCILLAMVGGYLWADYHKLTCPFICSLAMKIGTDEAEVLDETGFAASENCVGSKASCCRRQISID
jgi:hypothetical protein